ncbi:MAG: pyridoxal phosphate-dependent aminotransferase [Clostridiales bacterium]|nr:pyridoxal phosphate-dependent aminotransferase [Clostridiales bacterium]
MARIALRAQAVSPSLTLAITAQAKRMKVEGKAVVSFGAGEPDFNTPDYICKAAKDALDMGLTKYTPAAGTEALRAAVADKLKADNHLLYAPEDIVISNGAKHALFNAFSAILDEGDEVIIPAPYWLTYPELVKLCGGVNEFVRTKAEKGFKLTAAELEKAITPKTKAGLINNPCNPTGAVYSEKELKALARVLEKHEEIFIISDEIYEKLIYDLPPCYSIAEYSPQIKARTILVNGVSKTYAMTGWRIGYTASDRAVAKAIAGMQSHTTSNPNAIAQYAALGAYTGSEGEAFLAQMRQTFDTRRKYMIETLEGMQPLTYIRPEGAFYMMVGVEKLFGKQTPRGVKIESAYSFATALLSECEVAVIPCEPFGADGYVRLSYAISLEDIKEGLSRIKAFADSLR